MAAGFCPMLWRWIFPEVLWSVNHRTSGMKNSTGKGNPLREFGAGAKHMLRAGRHEKSDQGLRPFPSHLTSFSPFPRKSWVSWKETSTDKTRCFWASLEHSRPPLTQRNPKKPRILGNHENSKWYLGMKGCRVVQELPRICSRAGKAWKGRGKASLQSLYFPSFLRNGIQPDKVAKARKTDKDLAHDKAKPWSTFQLWVQVKVWALSYLGQPARQKFSLKSHFSNIFKPSMEACPHCKEFWRSPSCKTP